MKYLLSEKTKAGLDSLISGNVVSLVGRKRQRHQGTVPQVASSGSSVVPAKIVSKDGAFYLVNVYANGFDEPVTETNVVAQILMLNYADTLPANTEVLVASNYIDATGGGET